MPVTVLDAEVTVVKHKNSCPLRAEEDETDIKQKKKGTAVVY